MKPDILERLLMDRALKRLDPDTEVLLADYLAKDAAAATQARELQETVGLATEIMRSPAPVVEMPTQIHRLVWRHRAEQVLALAASFVIGVGLTALVIHSSLRREYAADVPRPVTVNSPKVAALRPALVKSQIESLPFWSNQRIYLLASATEQSRTQNGANSKEN
jgi:anti-sigma factor RsiW